MILFSGENINIKNELSRLGLIDQYQTYIKYIKEGKLGRFLKKSNKSINYGLLGAIFSDAIKRKRKIELRTGIIKMFHRILPMALAPFFPIIAIIGYILGTSRAFNKVIAPIIADPTNENNSFINQILENTMKVAEGDIVISKDRFRKTFVVSSGIVDIIKPEILEKFSLYIIEKMNNEDPDKPVPDDYIEVELKDYLYKKHDIEL
jgi:hypothetical protein